MRAMFILVLAACRGGEAPSDDAEDSATPPPPVCDAVTDGLWSASGPGFGMPMETTITFDPSACTFVAQDWSMVHTSQMTGGVVDVDQVTLSGTDAYWSSCTGTLSDATLIEGSCAAHASDGSFTLTWVE